MRTRKVCYICQRRYIDYSQNYAKSLTPRRLIPCYTFWNTVSEAIMRTSSRTYMGSVGSIAEGGVLPVPDSLPLTSPVVSRATTVTLVRRSGERVQGSTSQ